MARKKEPGPAGFVLFDVVYDDGMLSSNRKVPDDIANGFEGDAGVKAFLEAQDREVGEKSGRPRGRIKTLARSARRTLAAVPSKFAASARK